MKLNKPVQWEQQSASGNGVSVTLSRLRTGLEELGFEVDAHHNKLIGKKGSRSFTRVFGAFFVSTRHLPVCVELDVTETSRGASVKIKLSDDLGWGIRAGLEEVYLPYFGTISEELARKTALFDLTPTCPQPERSRRKQIRVLLVFAAVIIGILLLLDLFEVAGTFLLKFLHPL